MSVDEETPKQSLGVKMMCDQESEQYGKLHPFFNIIKNCVKKGKYGYSFTF